MRDSTCARAPVPAFRTASRGFLRRRGRGLSLGPALGSLVIGALALAGCPVIEPVPPLLLEELTPDRGFSLHIEPFEVPPGVEVQDCFFVEVPDINDGQDIWVDRFAMTQRGGSHHMNVFRVNSILHLSGRPGDVVRGGECRISTNWSDWPLVVNSQEGSDEQPIVDWTLPDGVAQRFRPGELLMVQSHYVNASLQKTPGGGEVRINFYKSRVASPIEMGTLFATQQSIRICRSNPVVSYDGACSFPPTAQVHIAAANGHFHGRGTSLQMYTWDGLSLDHPGPEAMFYESLEWNEPPMAVGLDEIVPAGGGVWWTCNYEWREPEGGCAAVDERDDEQRGDCCYTFGNSAENAEHCNVFVYYWPKVDSSIFCN
jgi:hypothetical protein